MSARMGEAPEDDLLSIIVRDMTLGDLMLLLNGNVEVLDKNTQNVKYRFQNAVIKFGNNKQKLREEFFKDMKSFIKEELLEKNKDKIYEGFDIQMVCEQVYENYMEKFS